MVRLRPIYVAYALLGCFTGIERLLRQGERARSLDAGQEDKGSTRAVGAAFGVGVLTLMFAPLMNKLKVARVSSETLAWTGVASMIVGLAARILATQVLGRYYTRTLRTQEEQHLITGGPYRLVRHPGYLGTLLLWLGAGLASGNGIVAAVISVTFLRTYRYRIQAEEKMLSDAFPEEYPAYAKRTWRLIPHIY